MLFLMAFVMLIATYIIIRRIPSLYESNAMVVVTTQTLPEDFTQKTSFASVMQHLTSRGNLAGVVQRHKLYPQITNIDAAIGKLGKDIKLDVKMRGYYPDGPESISISYRYTDPIVAQKVMSDVVGNFEQANQSIRQQATSEANRMNEKISEIEERLKRIAPQQAQEAIRSQAMARQATRDAIERAERKTAESSVASLGDKEFQLQRQINDLQQQIVEQENFVRQRSSSSSTTNPVLGPLLVRKADLEAQIKSYLTVYTEKNPKVVAAREQLNQINREIARLESSGGDNSATVTPEMIELKRLKQQLRQLETDLEVVRRDLGRKQTDLTRLPATGGAGSVDSIIPVNPNDTRTEYDRLLVRYNSMLEKQDGLIKLSGIAGSGAPMFQIVDLPQKPDLPVAPNRFMLQLIALGVSLGFGLFVVFLLELPRMFLLNDESDIEYYLGAPVIALIPETFTPVENSRNRRLRWTRGLIFLLLAAGLIPVLIVVLSRIQIFQILGSR